MLRVAGIGMLEIVLDGEQQDARATGKRQTDQVDREEQ
jgi:hypothetical protein